MEYFSLWNELTCMSSHDHGIKYKASPRAYIANYVIAAGLVFVAILVIRKFELSFSAPPATIGELGSTLVYAIFFGAAAWLTSEPLIEWILRHYLVSKHEVVKVEGIFNRRRHAIPYQSVSGVSVTKGIFGRLLNYGTVEVQGMSEGKFLMKHVGNPDEIHRLIRHKVGSRTPPISHLVKMNRPAEKKDKEEVS